MQHVQHAVEKSRAGASVQAYAPTSAADARLALRWYHDRLVKAELRAPPHLQKRARRQGGEGAASRSNPAAVSTTGALVSASPAGVVGLRVRGVVF